MKGNKGWLEVCARVVTLGEMASFGITRALLIAARILG
jgi:hypothetical protein